MPQFPLQSVLEHRQRVEEQRQTQAAIADLHLSQTEAVVALARSRLTAALAQIDAFKAARSVDGHALVAAEASRARAQTALESAEVERNVARKAAEDAHAAAISAGQDRISIEKLHDSFIMAARRKAEHVEEERLGEMSLLRWRSQAQEKGGNDS